MLLIAPAATEACSVANTRWPLLAARHRRLGRDRVADLADHDHVGRLTQHARQHVGEVEIDLRRGPPSAEPAA